MCDTLRLERLLLKEQHDFVDFPLERLPIQGVIQETLERIAYHDKLNACKLVRTYKDVDVFVYELDKPQMQTQISRDVKNLLVKLHIQEVLLVGLDSAWDKAIMSALPPQVKTIWFVNEDELVMKTLLSMCEQVEQFRYIVGGNGNYEDFIKALYWYLNPGVPPPHQLMREIINQQRLIQRDLMELKDKCEDMYKNIVLIKQMVSKISQTVEELERQ